MVTDDLDIHVYDDKSNIPKLVRADIRRCVALSKMTPLESKVFWLYEMNGLSIREIADIEDLPYDLVRKALRSAWRKAEHVPHCGVITVLYEVFEGDIGESELLAEAYNMEA